MLNNKSVEDAWNIIKNEIVTAQGMFVPNRFINNNRRTPRPFAKDDTLHFLLKQKRHYFKIHKKYNNPNTLYDYQSARNNVSKKIKLLKKGKESKIAKNIKENPKAFYQYVSSKLLKKEGVADLVNSNGELTKMTKRNVR